MAKRSPHFHNVPTVSIKSNYIVDGNLDLNGVLKLTGKLVINGEEVIPGSGGSVSITAGEGVKVDGTKISIDKKYIEDVVENTIQETESKIENLTTDIDALSQRIENIEQNGSSNKVLEEKVETLENTIRDLESNIGGFVSKDELSEAVEEISNRIDSLAHFTVRVESELPETLIENSIYLIPSEDGDEDFYTEYITYKNSEGEIVSELIGSTKIDLSDYVTKDQLSNLATKEEIETINSRLDELTQATEECKARKHHVIVSELPPKEEADDRLLYLLRNYHGDKESYDEFVFNPSKWEYERVGVDASLYAKQIEVDELRGYINTNDGILVQIEERLTYLEKNAGGSSNPGSGGSSCDCGDRLNVIESEISDLWNNKIGKTDFNNLSSKVTDIEQEIANIKNSINNGETGGGSGEGGSSCNCDLTQIESEIETLKTDVSSLSSSIENKVSAEDLTSAVTSTKIELEAKINTLETSVDASLASVGSDIESIKRRLSLLEEANPDIPSNPEIPGDEEEETPSFEYGKSYETLGKLIDDISSLEEGKVYSVTDKNTIEEYILKDGEIVQVSGGFNMQVSGDMDDETAVSPMRDKIENGEIMYNMPELVNGDFLFKGCDNLKVFVSDTPSLITARQMFYKCVNLETFCGVLSLLEDGTDMFVGCKLDEESILNIVDSINDFGQDGETRIITIGYNPESIIDGSIEDYTEEFSQKGWTVEWDARS